MQPGCGNHCGSGLARDTGDKVLIQNRIDTIAGKPGSHTINVVY